MIKTCIVLILLSIILTSCGYGDKIEATVTGYSDNCIDGVMYYQFRNGASVAYDIDGNIKQCE